MPRAPRWDRMVDAARDEALTAVYFYNRPDVKRRLETFLVHMHIAWTYLLHAEFERAGIKYFYRDPNRKDRYQKVDGQRKAWDLSLSIGERWSDQCDPVRQNIALTVALRNRIQHRYNEGLVVAAAGFAQALLMNFEDELVASFGSDHSIADVVHIPVSLSTFSREGAARLLAAQRSLPSALQDFFIEYRSGLGDGVASDRRFEFRVELVQKGAPKSDADLAVSFVREDELSVDELTAYEVLEKTGRIVLRDKARPVSNLGKMRPSEVCKLVEAAIPFRFRPSVEFPQAWKHFKARPPTKATGQARMNCNERYCAYDAAHDDYVYTRAFADLLVRDCGTEEGFQNVIGRPPTSKA